MSISFVIIGRNIGTTINKCLNSVMLFIYNNSISDFQIIYVDSNSTDDSIINATKFDNVFIVKISGDINAAVGRNVGAKYATKEYLFFIDGDMEISSEFYKSIVLNGKLTYDFISGDFINYYYSNNLIVASERYYKLTSDTFQNTTGGIFIIKKLLWDEMLGMQVKYRRCQDLDFGLRMSNKGYPILRKSEIIAFHHTISYYQENRLWSDLFNGNQFYQKSVLYRDHIFNSKIYPILFREITLFFLIFFLFISIIFNLLFIFPYFFILIIKAIYKHKNGVSKSFLTRVVYYFLLDIFSLFGFFFFWPKNHKKYNIEIHK
jgi:glycosyltransferase involved in cell wall biosynthesis